LEWKGKCGGMMGKEREREIEVSFHFINVAVLFVVMWCEQLRKEGIENLTNV
jgi:predicted nucleic acid-binding Zn ribbon protein